MALEYLEEHGKDWSRSWQRDCRSRMLRYGACQRRPLRESASSEEKEAWLDEIIDEQARKMELLFEHYEIEDRDWERP